MPPKLAPNSDLVEDQLTVDYLQSKVGSGFKTIGRVLEQSGGSTGTSTHSFSEYGTYTTKHDCFLCWGAIVDNAGNITGSHYIKLNDVAITGSGSDVQFINWGRPFTFQGPVKAGTTIKLVVPYSTLWHYCSWRAVEFELS